MPSKMASSEPHPADRGDHVRRIYDRRFDDDARAEKSAVWKVIVERYLQRWVPADATVLDVGCGFGEFLNHIRCRRRIGVDMNPASASFLDPGVEFHCADATNLTSLPIKNVDIVFTSNFMEHLPNKEAVHGVIAEAHRVLAPGGSFIALGPNVRVIPGAYWDYWDHLVPISDRSLVELLEISGFDVVDCFPRFLPYETRSWAPKTPFLVRLYLGIPMAWRLMGKQFLVRALKR